MPINKHIHFLLAPAIVVLVSGCASVSVREGKWSSQNAGLPEKFYVADFSVDPDVLKVDRTGDELEAFSQALSRSFSAELRDRICETIAPALPMPSNGRVGGNSWVVEGRFMRVNQGSRFLRSLVGFGAGGTKFETLTTVSEVLPSGKRRSLGMIETTGGSNAEPGLLTLPSPVTGPVRAVLSATLTGLTSDQRRTARMIAASIAQKLKSRGYALRGEPEPVKRLGSSLSASPNNSSRGSGAP
ncbi:MAG: DUF4410 domain-containing protein [Chthoniobacterales bacterium]|nr:DUF4410 domain-containing protein [Chthoniobacterales bacterium]